MTVAVLLSVLLQPAEPPALWNYVASNDRRGHWLFLTAAEADVRTPAGRLPADPASGVVPLRVEARCREGEGPVEVALVFPPHPDERDTTRTLSLQNLWWELTGTTPAARSWGTRVTLGSATFSTAFVRPSVVYEFEPDYRAALEVGATTVRLLRATERSPLRLRATGPLQVEASFAAPTGYRDRLRQMLAACGPAEGPPS